MASAFHSIFWHQPVIDKCEGCEFVHERITDKVKICRYSTNPEGEWLFEDITPCKRATHVKRKVKENPFDW